MAKQSWINVDDRITFDVSEVVCVARGGTRARPKTLVYLRGQDKPLQLDGDHWDFVLGEKAKASGQPRVP